MASVVLPPRAGSEEGRILGYDRGTICGSIRARRTWVWDLRVPGRQGARTTSARRVSGSSRRGV